MNEARIKQVVEATLLAAGRPLNLDQILTVFGEPTEQPPRESIRAALAALDGEYADRSFELKQVASGWRIQVRAGFAEQVGRLWEERPTRYSRALLETLALIAYRQPITRGEIEEVRGVTVSTSIMKTLLERQWVRIVGHRDVPGRPGLYGTTREFLDYFGLKSLDELPTLAELRDIDSLNVEMDLGDEAPERATQSVEEPATLGDDESEVVVNE
jgi:segregation and condensation protein B